MKLFRKSFLIASLFGMIIVLASCDIASTIAPGPSKEERAYNAATEKLDSMYFIRSFDEFTERNVRYFDFGDEPYYRVVVFYEATTQAGTIRSFSSTCRVPANSFSSVLTTCTDDWVKF